MTNPTWLSLWFAVPASATALLIAGCPADPITVDDSGSSSTTSVGSTTTDTPTTNAASESSDSAASATTMPLTSGGASSTGTAMSSTGPDDTTGEPPPPPTCGNNVIEGDEVCDLTQLNGETCTSLGYQGGTLGCLLDCSDYNLLGCFICGNDVVDVAEDCEPNLGIPKGTDCMSLGFEGGNLTCDVMTCLYDTSDCSICGDGVQQGDEDCDGIDLGGETCMSIGFDMGNLACNVATCSYNYADCSGGQYFQDFEGEMDGGPLPSEFTTGGAANWIIDGPNAIAGSLSASSTDLGEGQTNFMSLDVNFAVAGDISFLHSESSEGSFDYLQFYMDGVLQQEWSGINPPAMFSMPVAAGVHSFEWRYDKDGVVSVGLDRVWVDDISITGGVPI